MKLSIHTIISTTQELKTPEDRRAWLNSVENHLSATTGGSTTISFLSANMIILDDLEAAELVQDEDSHK